VFRQLFENVYRKEILKSRLLMVQGRVQKQDGVTHIIVRHCEDWSKMLRSLSSKDYNKILMHTLSPRDEKDGSPFKGENKKTQVRQQYHQEELFPDARNFR